MRQQCGGPVTIHRLESENQSLSNRSFCQKIGTPASLREERGAVLCRGRRELEYCGDPPMSTLYHILGLPKGANHEQVKAAFRTRARRFHPDVNAGNAAAEERFKEVSQAYETLADPTARAAYDRALVCRAAGCGGGDGRLPRPQPQPSRCIARARRSDELMGLVLLGRGKGGSAWLPSRLCTHRRD